MCCKQQQRRKQLLRSSLSHLMLGNETKGYFEAFFLGVYGMDFYSDRSNGEMFLASFVVGPMMVMDTYVGIAPIH